MNKTDEIKSTVVLDKSVSVDIAQTSVYEISMECERDARRYNRAFFEEQEVAVR